MDILTQQQQQQQQLDQLMIQQQQQQQLDQLMIQQQQQQMTEAHMRLRHKNRGTSVPQTTVDREYEEIKSYIQRMRVEVRRDSVRTEEKIKVMREKMKRHHELFDQRVREIRTR